VRNSEAYCRHFFGIIMQLLATIGNFLPIDREKISSLSNATFFFCFKACLSRGFTLDRENLERDLEGCEK
jgi:hypothetical protein